MKRKWLKCWQDSCSGFRLTSYKHDYMIIITKSQYGMLWRRFSRSKPSLTLLPCLIMVHYRDYWHVYRYLKWTRTDRETSHSIIQFFAPLTVYSVVRNNFQVQMKSKAFVIRKVLIFYKNRNILSFFCVWRIWGWRLLMSGSVLDVMWAFSVHLSSCGSWGWWRPTSH